MLTYSVGYAGAPWTGVAMAQHLRTPTLTAAIEAELVRGGLEPVATAAATLPLIAGDLHPELARRLAIAPGLNDLRQIAALLSGHAADGRPIPGAVRRRISASLAAVVGLEGGRLPSVDDLTRLAAIAHPDACGRGAHAARCILAFYGIEPGQTITLQSALAMAAGRCHDGSVLNKASIVARLKRTSSRISYIDFTISADKSTSVGFALTQGAERAIVAAAHHDAADETVRDICDVIRAVRRGDGGRFGTQAGHCARLVYRHYTARPTGVDRRGRVIDQAHQPGNAQLHDHFLVLNAVLLPDGSVGSLDLGAILRTRRIHEFGALYQARVAQNLRRAGIDVEYDRERRCANVTSVSSELRAAFSTRTISGIAKAAAYAGSRGFDLADVETRTRVRLIKRGVQAPDGARGDDIANETAWRDTAAAFGPEPTFVGSGKKLNPTAVEDRIGLAVSAAIQARADAAATKQPISDRVSALRGLVAAGFERLADVDEVVARMQVAGPSAVAKHDRDPCPTFLAARRAAGTAILIEGSPANFAERLGLLWHQRWSGQLNRPEIIGCADAGEASLVADAIRTLRRSAGEIGEEAMRIELADGTVLPLAVGDIVALTAPVNAAGEPLILPDGSTGGKRRQGRIGMAGSRLLVEGLERDRIFVSNHKGRRGTLSLPRALYDSANDRMRLACGYTTLRADDPRATILSCMKRVHPAAAVASSATLLCFSLEKEKEGLGRSATVKDVWDNVARKMEPRGPKPEAVLSDLRALRCRVKELTRGYMLAEEDPNLTWTLPAIARARFKAVETLAVRLGSLSKYLSQVVGLAKTVVAPADHVRPRELAPGRTASLASREPASGMDARIASIRAARQQVERWSLAIEALAGPAPCFRRARRRIAAVLEFDEGGVTVEPRGMG